MEEVEDVGGSDFGFEELEGVGEDGAVFVRVTEGDAGVEVGLGVREEREDTLMIKRSPDW